MVKHGLAPLQVRSSIFLKDTVNRLADLLDHLADDRGKLDTRDDGPEIARHMRLLCGVADEPR